MRIMRLWIWPDGTGRGRDGTGRDWKSGYWTVKINEILTLFHIEETKKYFARKLPNSAKLSGALGAAFWMLLSWYQSPICILKRWGHRLPRRLTALARKIFAWCRFPFSPRWLGWEISPRPVLFHLIKPSYRLLLDLMKPWVFTRPLIYGHIRDGCFPFDERGLI